MLLIVDGHRGGLPATHLDVLPDEDRNHEGTVMLSDVRLNGSAPRGDAERAILAWPEYLWTEGQTGPVLLAPQG